jgi:hypothetical protein
MQKLDDYGCIDDARADRAPATASYSRRKHERRSYAASSRRNKVERSLEEAAVNGADDLPEPLVDRCDVTR